MFTGKTYKFKEDMEYGFSIQSGYNPKLAKAIQENGGSFKVLDTAFGDVVQVRFANGITSDEISELFFCILASEFSFFEEVVEEQEACATVEDAPKATVHSLNVTVTPENAAEVQKLIAMLFQ